MSCSTTFHTAAIARSSSALIVFHSAAASLLIVNHESVINTLRTPATCSNVRANGSLLVASIELYDLGRSVGELAGGTGLSVRHFMALGLGVDWYSVMRTLILRGMDREQERGKPFRTRDPKERRDVQK